MRGRVQPKQTGNAGHVPAMLCNRGTAPRYASGCARGIMPLPTSMGRSRPDGARGIALRTRTYWGQFLPAVQPGLWSLTGSLGAGLGRLASPGAHRKDSAAGLLKLFLQRLGPTDATCLPQPVTGAMALTTPHSEEGSEAELALGKCLAIPGWRVP